MDVKTILHPTDGSDGAGKAFDFACDLAVANKARLLILHVQRRHGSERIPRELEEFSRLENVRETEAALLHAVAERIAREAEEKARMRGLSAVETTVLEGDPAHRIVEQAQSRNVDMIVLGSRGLGDLQGLLLGSVSHKVAHTAPCSCVIVR